MANKIWFITGASRGLGRVWAEAALKRGDKVAATARKAEDIADLKERFGDLVLTLALDVNDATQVTNVVAQAHAHFGKLDVVLNNAGYPLVATTEEANEADVQALFNTNYFGTLRVIQAALPFLRQQGGGHILGVSSTMGLVSMPLIGFYCASKWALEALHESLAQEVAAFGINVTLIELGAYATEFGGPSSAKLATELEAYADVRKQVYTNLGGMERGNPQTTAEALFKIVDAEKPPLRCIVGKSGGLSMVQAAYAKRLSVWEEWDPFLNAPQQGKQPAKV